MKRIIKYILTIMLVLIGILQIYIYNDITNKERDNSDLQTEAEEDYENLTDVTKDLECLNEKDILSASQVDNKWKITIKLSGEKDDILNDMMKLKKYDIESYIINKNKDENCITLELTSKNAKINL